MLDISLSPEARPKWIVNYTERGRSYQNVHSCRYLVDRDLAWMTRYGYKPEARSERPMTLFEQMLDTTESEHLASRDQARKGESCRQKTEMWRKRERRIYRL